MPYTSDDLLLLASQEWERVVAWYGLARHCNRSLPELERPEGWGYTIGYLQMHKLVADRRQQLGEAFVLCDFHDQAPSRGTVAVIPPEIRIDESRTRKSAPLHRR
jgi:hypothetical protein